MKDRSKSNADGWLEMPTSTARAEIKVSFKTLANIVFEESSWTQTFDLNLITSEKHKIRLRSTNDGWFELLACNCKPNVIITSVA